MQFNNPGVRFALMLTAAFFLSNAWSSPLGARAAAGSSAFIENRGQWDGQALYLSKTPGLNLWITQLGPILSLGSLCKLDHQRKIIRPGISKGTS